MAATLEHSRIPLMTDATNRADEFDQLLHLVKGSLLNYIAAADSRNTLRQASDSKGTKRYALTTSVLPPESVSQYLNLNLAEQSQGKDGVHEIVNRILDVSCNTWDQGFMHKLYAGTNPIGVISELLLAVLNTASHVYAVSPALSVIEKQVGCTLAHMFGLSDARSGGVTQPGGSASNFSSVLIARHRAQPLIKERGVLGTTQLVMFTSVDSHYSLDKAAQMTGIGSRGVRKIPTDAQGRMSVPALRASILQSLADGEQPFYVNATAGTTVRGAYDPIDDIAAVCHEFGLWLHVDGSLGGSAVFSRRHAWRIRGSEHADSITINPHKMLGVPVTCSFLLGRDLAHFRAAHAVDASYLFHEESELSSAIHVHAADTYDLAELTPQCGRRGDALKVALSWTYYGRAGYEAYVDAAFDAAAYLASLVDTHPRMELAGSPHSVQVCFYYMPIHGRGGRDGENHEQAVKHNTAMTASISDGLPSEGFMVDFAPGPIGKFLRAVTNGTSTRGAMDRLVAAIDKIGQGFMVGTDGAHL